MSHQKATLSREATDRDPLLHAAHPTSTSLAVTGGIGTSTAAGGGRGPVTATHKYQGTGDVALEVSQARLSSLKEAAITKPRPKRWSIGGSGLVWFVARIVLHCALLGVHGYMIYVAQTYNSEEYDCEHKLDQWAWLQGVGILSLSFIYVVRAFAEDRMSESWDTCCFRFSWCFNIIATLTALAWTILGSVWTFSIDPSSLVCPRALYDICWYYLIIFWSLLASFVGIALCVACIFCMKLRT